MRTEPTHKANIVYPNGCYHPACNGRNFCILCGRPKKTSPLFLNYHIANPEIPSKKRDKDYRFGFNGQEKDNELKGIGNQLDFSFRAYDSRLGKFLSQDPLHQQYYWNSPYAFAENTPIMAIDLEGLEKFIVTTGQKDGITYRFVKFNKNDPEGTLGRFGYTDENGNITQFSQKDPLDPMDQIYALEIENSRTGLITVGVPPPPGATTVVQIKKSRPVAPDDDINPILPPPGQTLSMPLIVSFNDRSSDISNKQQAIQNITNVIDALKKYPKLNITLYGNAAFGGDATYIGHDKKIHSVTTLMQNRANAVRQLMIDQGVKPSQIKTGIGNSSGEMTTTGTLKNGEIIKNERKQYGQD